MNTYDVLIIGAGAAGLMCAIEAGKRGRRVLVLEQSEQPAEKIRISGGGRCNFTNIHCAPDRFLSENPHFCKSALARYTPSDFLALVEKHKIKWHEKTLGQLFCDDSAKQIIKMLLDECAAAGVTIRLQAGVAGVSHEKNNDGGTYTVSTATGPVSAPALVIATGGPSIPKMGSSGFGYDVARQFGVPVVPTAPALVPLTFTDEVQGVTKVLSGLAVDPAVVSFEGTSFREALLFTHRGLSGPAILQISSYWREGREISLNLAPDHDMAAHLTATRAAQPRRQLPTILGQLLPQRLADHLVARLAAQAGFAADARIADLPDKILGAVAAAVNDWRARPNGTEGFRTAEVTRGGVATDALSSKTFETTAFPGLFFIGEVVDVTGWLGGYNFQWAWSAGWCCGQAV